MNRLDKPAGTPTAEQDGGDLPFISHLVELRNRLLRVVIVTIAMALALTPFANDLYTALADPLLRALPPGSSMIAIEVASPFLAPFKLALVLGLFIAMPYLLYQVWAFVAPGLYRHEQRLALPLLVSGSALFYAGAAFAYFVVFPLVFGVLTAMAPTGVTVMTDINKYLDFAFTLFFAFGIAFEVPIAILILTWMGVVEPRKLRSKRPYVIVLAFVIGAILTPPDPVTQTLLAVPMWLLYEVGVWIATLMPRRRSEDEATEESASA